MANFKLSLDDEKEILCELLLVTKYEWKQHPKYNEEKFCDICMDEMKNEYILQTNCCHFFHRDCIMEALIRYKFLKCPKCMKSFNKN